MLRTVHKAQNLRTQSSWSACRAAWARAPRYIAASAHVSEAKPRPRTARSQQRRCRCDAPRSREWLHVRWRLSLASRRLAPRTLKSEATSSLGLAMSTVVCVLLVCVAGNPKVQWRKRHPTSTRQCSLSQGGADVLKSTRLTLLERGKPGELSYMATRRTVGQLQRD